MGGVLPTQLADELASDIPRVGEVLRSGNRDAVFTGLEPHRWRSVLATRKTKLTLPELQQLIWDLLIHSNSPSVDDLFVFAETIN